MKNLGNTDSESIALRRAEAEALAAAEGLLAKRAEREAESASAAAKFAASELARVEAAPAPAASPAPDHAKFQAELKAIFAHTEAGRAAEAEAVKLEVAPGMGPAHDVITKKRPGRPGVGGDGA